MLTKYNRHLFPHNFGCRESEIKVSAGSLSSEASLLRLQKARSPVSSRDLPLGWVSVLIAPPYKDTGHFG